MADRRAEDDVGKLRSLMDAVERRVEGRKGGVDEMIQVSSVFG